MKPKIFIFDFDGTIANTLSYIVKLSADLSREFHFKDVSPHDVEWLRDKTSQEIIRHLNIPIIKIPVILKKVRKRLNEEITLIKPVKGLGNVLFRLKSLEHTLGILTSNSAENVKKFLKTHQLNIFDFIHATSKIWGKNAGLTRLMKHYGLHANDIIYIGDEIRDIAAAKKANIKVAAVTWGYNSKKALLSCNPDYVIDYPEELLSLHPESEY